MRVRTLHLRLLGALLTVLWAAAAAALLIGYRPGGRFDPLVAAAPVLGAALAAVTAVWPPVARGARVATLVAWLGILAVLLVVPALGGVLGMVGQPTPSPLLPSVETAYGWGLALATTGLFGGLGTAGRILGAGALRRTRIALGLSIAVAVTSTGLGISGMALLGNALALGTGPIASQGNAPSDWGPADPALAPPSCTGSLAVGPAARVSIQASAEADGHLAGSVSLQGQRTGADERWQATLTVPTVSGMDGAPSTSAGSSADGAPGASATPTVTSRLAYIAVGRRAWLRVGTESWQAVTPAGPRSTGSGAGQTGTLDQAIVEAALTPGRRLAAEDLGIELLGRVAARHCRLAVDGPTALAAFRPLRWLIGQAPLATATALGPWRGELDWWVFGDDQLGMARVRVGGQPLPGWGGVLQGSLTATLTARDRTVLLPIAAPTP